MHTAWTIFKGLIFLVVVVTFIFPLAVAGATDFAFIYTVGGLWAVWGLKAPFRVFSRA